MIPFNDFCTMVDKALAEYETGLLNKTPKEIIDEAYQLVTKREFAAILTCRQEVYDLLVENEKYHGIMNDTILDWFYNEWLEWDHTLYNEFSEFMIELISQRSVD